MIATFLAILAVILFILLLLGPPVAVFYHAIEQGFDSIRNCILSWIGVAVSIAAVLTAGISIGQHYHLFDDDRAVHCAVGTTYVVEPRSDDSSSTDWFCKPV